MPDVTILRVHDSVATFSRLNDGGNQITVAAILLEPGSIVSLSDSGPVEEVRSPEARS